MSSGKGVTHISYWSGVNGFDEVRLAVNKQLVSIPTLPNKDLEEFCSTMQRVIDDYRN